MASPTLFIRLGFSHDRRLEVFVLLVFFLFLVVIIVVGISRRHLVADDCEEAPVNRPSRNTFKDTQDHVGSYWMSRHSWPDVTVQGRGWPDLECAMALASSIASRVPARNTSASRAKAS
jgi:hypothetical protein